MNLLDSFQRYIDENDLATHDDRILLTVSGGVDSMVMLSLFTRCGYRVGVAHCNFQLRGAETVSYTHRDVYKRQGLRFVLFRSSISTPPTPSAA